MRGKGFSSGFSLRRNFKIPVKSTKYMGAKELIMKIVCLGDSLTFGYGVSKSKNWVELLNVKGSAQFVNKGISGDTSGGMLSRFHKDVIEEKPKYVVIMGGVNDLIAGASLGVVQANIMAMVHQAHHYKIIPVLATSIMLDIDNIRKDWAELSDFKTLNESILEYRDWMMKFSGTFSVDIIDVFTKFHDVVKGDYKRYFIDGIHPTEEGNKILAAIVQSNIFY